MVGSSYKENSGYIVSAAGDVACPSLVGDKWKYSNDGWHADDKLTFHKTCAKSVTLGGLGAAARARWGTDFEAEYEMSDSLMRVRYGSILHQHANCPVRAHSSRPVSERARAVPFIG